MNKLHVKKGDTVVVISGNSKGVKGKVLEVSPKERKVIVEGANIVTKHVKPRKQGEAGGLVKVEGALYASKVQLYCSNCGKGVRSGYKIENGEKTRICRKCGKNI